MQKEFDINNQKFVVNTDNSKIEFVLDNNLLYSGIPFIDVVDYTDVELDGNKIFLTARIKQKSRIDLNTVVEELVPIKREFDTALLTSGTKEETTSAPDPDSSSEEPPSEEE